MQFGNNSSKNTAAGWLVPAVAAAVTLLGRNALAQVSFTIDFQGPKGMPDFIHGAPISEGDILMPPFGMPAPGPTPFPGAVFLAGANPLAVPNLGLPAYVFGPKPPGVPSHVEVDALSYGSDSLILPAPIPTHIWTFTVDEFASGIPSPAMPGVFSQGVFGAVEASSDIFMKFPPGPMPPAPAPPFAWPPGNTLLFDGNGMPAPAGPLAIPLIPGLLGLGVIQPNPPTPFALPDPGMHIDDFDIDSMPAYPIFFSLDSWFPDPLEPGAIVNSGSAMANGHVGGDVLVKLGPVGLPVVYAPAAALGLNIVPVGMGGGPDSDDLDALVLHENGVAGFQPSLVPYDWVGGDKDMLLFSVRRGSAVIGKPDSIFGIPICEGDILTTPKVGGMSPYPGIFIAAENLGLATVRSTPGLLAFPPFSDDLTGLDVSPDCNIDGIPDYWDIKWGLTADCNGNGVPDSCDLASGVAHDCNGNGIPDSCDIASGFSTDANGNGIPDSCECMADVAPAGGNGVVNVDDLLYIIAHWGPCGAGACLADIAPPGGNGTVNVDDLLYVIAHWGPCP